MSPLKNCLQHLPSKGFFDLPTPGTITVSGEDAKTFLQGQLSCNLNDISPSKSRLGAYCDIKGRVVGFFRILQTDHQYHLIMAPDLVDQVVKTMHRYAVFSKVNLDSNPAFSQRIGVMGENLVNNTPEDLLSTLGLVRQINDTISSTLSSPEQIGETSTATLSLPQQVDETISQNSITLIRITGAYPRWELLLRATTLSPLKQPLQDAAAWEAHNILCGLPHFNAALSGQFTAHRLGLIRLNAVSFDKGCYLGQEIVARTQYLGSQKGGLYWAATESSQSFSPMNEINNPDQQLMGHIIECIPIKNSLKLLLAALKQSPQENDSFYIDNVLIPFTIPFSNEFI